MAGDVPAGVGVGVREECVGAGDIFFGLDGVDLKFGFAEFAGDGENSGAMDGAERGAESGKRAAGVEPGEVEKPEREKKSEKRKEDAARHDLV